jgi:hypothetical protein
MFFGAPAGIRSRVRLGTASSVRSALPPFCHPVVVWVVSIGMVTAGNAQGGRVLSRR